MKGLTENDINWIIIEPLTAANIGDGQPVPKTIMSIRKNIRKGDRVALLYHNDLPIYTEKVTGSTLKCILTSIERGMKKVIEINCYNTSIVYSTIGSFVDKNLRIELANKYENNRLTPADLVGDHIYYEGSMKKVKGIWVYDLGS